HLLRREATRHHLGGLHAAEQIVQDAVDLVVADPVVALRGLTGDQVWVGGLRRITSGTPTWRARARTCVLNRSPNGFTGGVSSACQVKYPKSRSDLLLVPMGRALYFADRSNSTIIRSRAITLPRRVGSAAPFCSTCER